MSFNAAVVAPQNTTASARPIAVDPCSSTLNLDCTECKNLEEQISVHKRTVEELREENKRSLEASKEFQVRMAALRDSTKTEQRAALLAADQIRVERDNLQARLARLEQVSSSIKRCLTVINTEAIPKIRTEKDALDIEVARLKAGLQEALGDVTKGRETDGQLRSKLLRLEIEARDLKAKTSGVKEEKSSLEHRLAQRTQELQSQTQDSSAALAQKDGAIQTLEANAGRSRNDLNAAIQKAQDLQERLNAQATTTDAVRAELDQLRKEAVEKDAANDDMDDRRFDAEVALANDRRAFQVVQQDLIERSREAEARSRHTENLLSESLTQMAHEREDYRLTLSIKPEADFLLLRVVTCEGTQIRMRDRILSPRGADKLLEQLQQVNHDLSQYTFLIGIWRQVLASSDTTYSSIRQAWRQRQVLWVLLTASYAEFNGVWTDRVDCNAMGELERKGFTLNPRGVKLVYSDPAGQQGTRAQRKRKPTTQWPGVRDRSRSPRREDRSRSPRREDRSRSPRREDRSRSPIHSRSHGRDRTDLARHSPPAGTHEVKSSARSALQLVGSSQIFLPTAGVVTNQESMQTVERIEDIMEDE